MVTFLDLTLHNIGRQSLNIGAQNVPCLLVYHVTLNIVIPIAYFFPHVTT